MVVIMKSNNEKNFKSLIRIIICLVLTAAMALSSAACARSLADDSRVEAEPEATQPVDSLDDNETEPETTQNPEPPEYNMQEVLNDMFRIAFNQNIVHASACFNPMYLSSYCEPNILIFNDELVPALSEAFQQVEFSMASEDEEIAFHRNMGSNYRYINVSFYDENYEKAATLTMFYNGDTSGYDGNDIGSLWKGSLEFLWNNSGYEWAKKRVVFKIESDPANFLELLEATIGEAIGTDFITYREQYEDLWQLKISTPCQEIYESEYYYLHTFMLMYPNARIGDFDAQYPARPNYSYFGRAAENMCRFEAVSPEE